MKMGESRSVDADIKFNQLVWVDWSGKSHWPAVALNPDEWDVPSYLETTKDEKLIWWLATNKKFAMMKVSADSCYDFVRYFDVMFSSSTKRRYLKAVCDAVQIVRLAKKKHNKVIPLNRRMILLAMRKIGSKENVIVQSKRQWKVALPEELHSDLIDPFHESEDESQNETESTTPITNKQKKNKSSQTFPIMAKPPLIVAEVEKSSNSTFASTETSRPIPNTHASPILSKYQCLLCPTMFSNFDEVKKHLAVHNSDRSLHPYSCNLCTFQSDSSLDVLYHSCCHFDIQV